MKFAHIISSSLLCSAAVLVADASQARELHVEQRVVSYADLNLDHSEGVKTLYGRIRGASRSVCTAAIGREPLHAIARRDCSRAATAAAVEDVADQRLTDYHTGRASSVTQVIASR